MAYKVLGSVIEAESGRPLEGLCVRAYDEDLFIDDYLGETRTDAYGRFEIQFTEPQFTDLHETIPDVYLRVFDPSGGRLLLSTEDRVRVDAQLTERFELRIPRAVLD